MDALGSGDFLGGLGVELGWFWGGDKSGGCK